jgi:hypothetical protein
LALRLVMVTVPLLTVTVNVADPPEPAVSVIVH